MKKIPVVILCILLAALLGACDQPTPSPSPSATASVTPVPTLTPQTTPTLSPTTQPTASPTPMPSITVKPSGVTEKKLGFVTDAYTKNGVNYIKIDYVDMYTGNQAIQQALKDNSNWVEQDEHGNYYIPNDYYIRNANNKIRTFPLDPNCIIRICDENDPSNLMKSISFGVFKSLSDQLMHVDVQNGVVVSMSQQYLP